jgi:23S rRNA pseudouridine1911/1915/1917 synthase
MKFTITAENLNQRLDKFLTEKLSGFSRSQIQKMIKNGEITVNGKKATPHHFLKESDEVVVLSPAACGAKDLVTKLKLPKFKVVAETKDYLVIEKPSGVAVHGASGITEPTLADALIKKYPEIKKIKSITPEALKSRYGAKAEKQRQGIVHRLDKDASGLMVVARTTKALKHLKEQFQERKVKKNYYALVEGLIESETGKITTPLQKNKEGLMAARTDANNEEAKEALTTFEVEKRFNNYTLLKVEIHTGRTHQIRAHMKSIGHPVVGDELYATRCHDGPLIKRRVADRAKLGRIFLHAAELGFFDLAKKWQEFKIILPKELKTFLGELK